MLVCPICGKPLAFFADAGQDSGFLRHDGGKCDEAYPVINGVPRLLRRTHRAPVLDRHHEWFELTAPRRELARKWQETADADRVTSGFDYEWTKFRQVGTAELGHVFDQYFDLVPPALFSRSLTALDAGCGAGRWSVEVAARGPRVVAVDLGLSIDVARSNCDPDRIACVQADLLDTTFASDSFDWGYSLGVLHHTADPAAALVRLRAALRPGAPFLLYLYYALDNRGRAFRWLFRMVDVLRRTTSLLPRFAVLVVSFLSAILLYWPLARLSGALARLGAERIADRLPLAGYRDRSFSIMWNDSLDRFGTTVEKRFTRTQISDLLEAAGFDSALFSERLPYWHVIARARPTWRQG
jgi:SAM-dependent methyltransferase/uncharacterized protein YbaR (Trm112 family)